MPLKRFLFSPQRVFVGVRFSGAVSTDRRFAHSPCRKLYLVNDHSPTAYPVFSSRLGSIEERLAFDVIAVVMLHVEDTVSVNDSVKYPAAANDNEGEEEDAVTAADVTDTEGEKGWLHDIVGGR